MVAIAPTGEPGALRLPSNPVDVVDIVLVVLLVAAAVHGLRLGALIQVLTFGGFLIGLTVGALLSEALVGRIHSPTVRSVATLALVMGLAILFGTVGRVVGGRSHAALRRHHLGQLDAVLGVAVAVVAVLVSAWLVSDVVASSRYTWLNSAISKSDILRSVDDLLPPVPSLFAHVQTFLSAEGFPPVFVNLSAPLAGKVALPTSSSTAHLADPAVFSTVKVLGEACGYQQEGSGFVVGPGLVVTNAHVVAGEPQTQIREGTGSYPATVVYYDPEFDMALLRTPAPLGPPLALDSAYATRGTEGAVLGYPENGSLTIRPAGVTANLLAEGRDIYDNALVTRDVYQIDADVEPGNSGGPLMGPGGQVLGIVFSRSTVYPSVGYALASPGVASRLARAGHNTAAVSTGACVEG